MHFLSAVQTERSRLGRNYKSCVFFGIEIAENSKVAFQNIALTNPVEMFEVVKI